VAARDPISRLSVAEIRRRVQAGEIPLTAQLLAKLQRDERRGVRALHASLRRRFERERDERLRMDGMLNFERILWRSGTRRVAGVDEAGVGPPAGPVVAAAVVFPPSCEIPGIDDSKRLDAETRLRLEEEIRKHASVAVGLASVAEIDRLNIHHAALLAMRRAVRALPEPPEHVLVDARTIPDLDLPQNRFSKGDGIDYSIAAASIVAKNHRDRLMEALDREHPGYGFARHKGYSTPEHQEAVRRLGPSPVHRRSFDALREWRGEYSERFYALRRELEAARGAEALQAFERRLRDGRSELPEVEQKKLRLLLNRRWKLLDGGSARGRTGRSASA